jgi:hypothetical protein
VVSGRDPFDGPLYVEVDGAGHALGGRLAAAMRVSPGS